MDSIIVQTNNQIKEKGIRLQQKTSMMLKSLRCNQSIPISNRSKTSIKKSNGTFFWALAAVTAVTAIVAPYKPVSVAVCGCAIIGGIKSIVGDKNTKGPSKADVHEDINQLTSQLINIVQTIKKEWDDFMEQKKAIIQNHIQTLDIEEEMRTKLYSFTYVTENIIFSASDIISEMNKLSVSENIATSFAKLKDDIYEKLCTSIDVTVNKQTKKYEDILTLLK